VGTFRCEGAVISKQSTFGLLIDFILPALQSTCTCLS